MLRERQFPLKGAVPTEHMEKVNKRKYQFIEESPDPVSNDTKMSMESDQPTVTTSNGTKLSNNTDISSTD